MQLSSHSENFSGLPFTGLLVLLDFVPGPRGGGEARRGPPWKTWQTPLMTILFAKQFCKAFFGLAVVLHI